MQSVCLPVGDFWGDTLLHAGHPFFFPFCPQLETPTMAHRVKSTKGVPEFEWTKWCILLRFGICLKERQKKTWKAHCSFYFSTVKYICLQPPLESAQSSLTTEDMFSLCENQRLRYTRKMLLFTPNRCLWEASVKTASVSKAKLIKVTIWGVRALIFDHSGLYENSKFACVLFPLWSANVLKVCNTHREKTDGFLSWISPLLNYISAESRGELYRLITILLKNTGVLHIFKKEDSVVTSFIS